MAHHYTLAILLEGAAVLTLLQLIKRYNQSIPEGRKTVRLEANCVNLQSIFKLTYHLQVKAEVDNLFVVGSQVSTCRTVFCLSSSFLHPIISWRFCFW